MHFIGVGFSSGDFFCWLCQGDQRGVRIEIGLQTDTYLYSRIWIYGAPLLSRHRAIHRL
jgi:hypothetical protein